METQAQITANKINFQNAGVKTDSDKEISKYNAIRHGVLQKTLIATEKDEVQTMLSLLLVEYEPHGVTDDLLLEAMVLAYIRMQRAIQTEKAFLTQGIFMPMIRYRSEETDKTDSIQVGNSEYEMLDKTYMRYITDGERQFYRALHEFQRVQSLRKGVKPSSIAVDLFKDIADQ
jgi:hypothetical protein